MSATIETTLQSTKNWPVTDQVALLHGLWDRLLESGWKPEITPEQKAEFDRRLDDLEAHPDNVLDWDQVVARLRIPT
jgi:putative addiction module component (TIGR02574 family)